MAEILQKLSQVCLKCAERFLWSDTCYTYCREIVTGVDVSGCCSCCYWWVAGYFRVIRVISGRTPMRAGKMVSPRPAFTYRYCGAPSSIDDESAASVRSVPRCDLLPLFVLYRPRYCGNIYLLGLHPNMENCIEWVCPESVRGKSWSTTSDSQCSGS